MMSMLGTRALRFGPLALLLGALLAPAQHAAGQVAVEVLALPAASINEEMTALPPSQTLFALGDTFYLEVWAQTTEPNGFATVGVDLTFDPSFTTAGIVTHSSILGLFTHGVVDNALGLVDDLSGGHPPATPPCVDQVGFAPKWALLASVEVTADLVGTATFQSLDTASGIWVTSICGTSVLPTVTYGGTSITIAQCGNGITELGEQCDDGNVLPGDCCDATCQFDAVGNACGDPSDTDCDNPDTCDGAGSCLVNLEPNGDAPVGLCDDVNDCTQNLCSAGLCVNPNEPTGTACGDPSNTDCDNPDTCDGAGGCLLNNEPDGAAPLGLCDDANECSKNLCGGGLCANPSEPVGTACGDPSDTDCDNPDTCDGSGVCLLNNEADGTAPAGLCDDANECTQNVCGGGLCANPNEAAGSACGDPSDTDCDNADSCDGAGSCVANFEPDGAAPAGLCGDANDCTQDLCNAGLCVNPSETAGTACGDPSDTDCDNADTCDGAGVCLANNEPDGAPPNGLCDDGNGCTTDSCQAGGCQSIDNTDPCDDGQQCTQNDTCGGGLCIGTPTPDCAKCAVAGDCDDGNACTTDSCPSGVCIYTNNADACDDNNACTTSDTCSAGSCVGGAPPNCDDANACTDDTCDPATGCVQTNNTAACSDGNVCTVNDVCSGGACAGTLEAQTPLVSTVFGSSTAMRRIQVTPLSPPPVGNPACNANAGACDQSNGTPGCNDVVCCNIVCQADPFCCDTSWDAICAEAASTACVGQPPSDGNQPIALLLTSPDWPCINLYVQADGSLSITPALQLAEAWGTVVVEGFEIAPESVYQVQATCGTSMTVAGSTTTAPWTDVDGDGAATLADVQFFVFGFQGDFSQHPLEVLDIWPCVPDGVDNFADIQAAVLAFQGLTYTAAATALECPLPCP